MAKLSILQITKDSGLFVIKHVFIIFILNLLAVHCFDGYLINLFNNTFYFRTNKIINSYNLFALLLSIVVLSIKFIVYSSTINNESSNGSNFNMFDYISEISERFINVFTVTVVVLLATVISSIFFIIPSIYVFSLIVYSLVFCGGKVINSKNKNNFQQNYNLNSSMSRSLEITKGHRFSLCIYNTVLFVLLFCLLYFFDYNFYTNDFINSNYLIKFCIVDIFVIIVLEFGFILDKIEDKEYESLRAKEKSKKYEMDKNKTRLSQDSKIKNLSESYIKKKIR